MHEPRVCDCLLGLAAGQGDESVVEVGMGVHGVSSQRGSFPTLAGKEPPSHRTDAHFCGDGRAETPWRTHGIHATLQVVKRFFSVLLVGVLLGLLLSSAIFLQGMRTNSPAVVGRVRRFNKAVTNPRVMQTAGTPGSTTSVIRHVGRSSGTDYATPIGAVQTEDGFVIGLPYRLDADWMKNVLAAGSATIVKDGIDHAVVEPEVVPVADVLEFFESGDHRAFALFNVENALRVRRADA